MLNAYAKGKVRTDEPAANEDVEFRRGVRLNEDVLTSSVFERLLYLPEPLFWSIITSASGANTPCDSSSRPSVASLIEAPNRIKDFQFWPRHPRHTDNSEEASSWCEPDLVVWFDRLCFIVEAKLEDVGQCPDQWVDQVLSVCQTPTNEPLQVVHLAIGGLGRIPSADVVGRLQDDALDRVDRHMQSGIAVTFIASSWFQLAQAVDRSMPKDGNARRIMRDVLIALSYYETQPRAYLQSFPKGPRATTMATSSIEQMSSWISSSKFKSGSLQDAA